MAEPASATDVTELAAPPARRVRTLTESLAIWLSIVLLARVFVGQFSYAWTRGNKTSEIADSYSESNSVRAGEGYHDKGLLSNHGLPDLGYGNRFAKEGWKPDCKDSCVYIQYPEGPDILVGIATIMFGKGKVPMYRLFPLAVGLLALAFFLASLLRVFSPWATFAVVLGCSSVPMFGNMMHGLHYQGHALSLLLIELSLCLGIFWGGAAVRWRTLAAFAGLGWVQGWLSFDYFFLVSFTAVPFWLAGEHWKTRAELLRVAKCVVAAGTGFFLAHFAHFIQVAIHIGGLGAAVHHFMNVASYRASWPLPPLSFPGVFGLVTQYWLDLLPSKRYLGYPFVTAVAALSAALAMVPTRRSTWRGWTLEWRSSRRQLLAFLAALLICSLWVVVMRAHSRLHPHFLPRHYFLVHAFGVMLVVRSVVLSRTSTPIAPPAAS